ncbi:hypothetical protein [Caudoviricetes sp.]|nr:hypothetical protein [Caudoviricetes sp.]
MFHVQLTREQAQHVATLLTKAREAAATYDAAVGLLTLGRKVPEAWTLADIDVDAGTLSFAKPSALGPDEPVAPTEG